MEALAVFDGQGETKWRVGDTIKAYEIGLGEKLILIGSYEEEETWVNLEDRVVLKELGLNQLEDVVIEPRANITPTQSKQLLDICQKLELSSVALFASPYFMVRAYFTTIKEMMKRGGDWISIIPIPVEISPNVAIPETEVNAWSMAPGEMERVLQYQKKGDVCSFEEMREYISWLWKNFLEQK